MSNTSRLIMKRGQGADDPGHDNPDRHPGLGIWLPRLGVQRHNERPEREADHRHNQPGRWTAVAAFYDSVASQSRIVYDGSEVVAGINVVKEQGGVCLIVINSTFDSNITSNRSATIGVFWIMSGAGMADALSTAPVEVVLGQTSQRLSRHLIDESL